MSVHTKNGSFQKNGKPFFLLSGEIHYFRLDPRLWEKHLLLLKQTGANTTSTYIPWDWHEYEEGKFDFEGKSHPARNIIRYIELCKKVGLDLIVKPGPYILAEYVHHGIPAWLVQRNVQRALALDENGKPIAQDWMTYLSEDFLCYTFTWYDQIMPIVAAYQESNHGPITMLQVCNEVGVFQWLSGKIDYSPSVLQLFSGFLRSTYGSVEKLNDRYGTRFSSFSEVAPPKGNIENRRDYCAYVDFHLFFRHYFRVYLETLVKKIRSFGLDLQLTHNIPGWIYGSASELPMLVSTYGDVFRNNPGLAFGLDHIPEYTSFRNAHDDLACNKILEAMQPEGAVWAAEFQAGSREHHVKNDARDMELFYAASLAHGIKGMNFYMFSQGVNPPGKGIFGKTFYFQTPLAADGTPSPLYTATRKLGRFIRQEGPHLLGSKTKADICVGLYEPYFHTFLTSSQLLKDRKLKPEKVGMRFDPRVVREELLFKGALRALQALNLNYDIRDLQVNTVESLLRYRQLWVVATDVMDAATQNLLVSYLNNGGNLVLFPAIPTSDLYLKTCTVLLDALNIRMKYRVSSTQVTAFGLVGMYTPTVEKQIFEGVTGEILSQTDAGDPCGFRSDVGNGTVTVFGYATGYTTEEHLEFYRRIAELDGVKPELAVSDPDIQFVLRRGRQRNYLFLLNYHNRRITFSAGSKRYNLGPFGWKIIKTMH